MPAELIPRTDPRGVEPVAKPITESGKALICDSAKIVLFWAKGEVRENKDFHDRKSSLLSAEVSKSLVTSYARFGDFMLFSTWISSMIFAGNHKLAFSVVASSVKVAYISG